MSNDILQVLKSAAGALLAQGALYAELLSLEWAEEKSRLFSMVLAVFIGLVFLLCSLLSLGALVIILSWGTEYQMEALIGLVAFFVLGLIVALVRVRALAEQGRKAFSGSITEISADIELIRDKFGD